MKVLLKYKKIIKNVILYFIIFFLSFIFSIFCIEKTFFDYYIPDDSLKGNMWLLVNAKSYEIYSSSAPYEYNLEHYIGARAIPELQKCIEKYTKNNKPKIAERCQRVLSNIK